MISVPNIDSKIWNIEKIALDIAEYVRSNQQPIIELNCEGPCATTLGIYDLLDDIVVRHNLNKNNITIITCNQIETHSEYKIKKIPPLYINETVEFHCKYKKNFNNKFFDNNFKKFGLFVGRSNWLRLWLASELHSTYHKSSILTFHYDKHIEFHRQHLGLEEWILNQATANNLTNAINLIAASPITIDEIDISYPILTPMHLNIAKIYHKFFCEIVCETYFTGNTFYPTEKIWRPIVMKTPFIVQGPAGYIKNLKKIGFQTFNQWWDEGYDEDPYNFKPIEILKIVKKLNRLSIDQLNNMYQEMQPILEHNQTLLYNLTPQKFKKIFNYS
jgi:hypothetical protein